MEAERDAKRPHVTASEKSVRLHNWDDTMMPIMAHTSYATFVSFVFILRKRIGRVEEAITGGVP